MAESCPKEINRFKICIEEEFEMTDLGKLSYFMGLEFLNIPKGMIPHQMK